jgi:hypothetical protein
MNPERILIVDCCVEDVFNNFISFEGNSVILDPSVGLDFIVFLEKIVGFKIEVFYKGENPVCSKYETKMWGNGHDTHLINKVRKVKKQSYVCPKCGTSTTTNLDFIPKGCNYTIDIQKEGLKQGLIGYKSLEKVAETIQDTYNCKPTRQTILYHMEKYSDEYLRKVEKYDIRKKIKKDKIGKTQNLTGIRQVTSYDYTVKIKSKNHKILPNTNNFIELYYQITLPQQLKRKYITIK